MKKHIVLCILLFVLPQTGQAQWGRSWITAGEANTASNRTGAGVGVFKTKSGVDLQFKRLKGLSGVLITDGTDSVFVKVDTASTAVETATEIIARIASKQDDSDTTAFDATKTYVRAWHDSLTLLKGVNLTGAAAGNIIMRRASGVWVDTTIAIGGITPAGARQHTGWTSDGTLAQDTLASKYILDRPNMRIAFKGSDNDSLIFHPSGNKMLSVKIDGGTEVFLVDSTGGHTISNAPLNIQYSASGANNITYDVLNISNNHAGGGGSSGFGSSLRFRLESLSTDDRDAGRISVKWTQASDANRFSRFTFSPIENSIESESFSVHPFGIAVGNLSPGAHSATSTIMIADGTAPNFSPSNTVQIYGDEIGGTTTGLAVRSESGKILYTTGETLILGEGDTKATPPNVTYRVTNASGTNVAGSTTYIAGSRATGNANSGSINFQTGTTGSSGSTLQTLNSRLTVNKSNWAADAPSDSAVGMQGFHSTGGAKIDKTVSLGSGSVSASVVYNATDGDQYTQSINTSDQAVFTGASGGYIFDYPISGGGAFGAMRSTIPDGFINVVISSANSWTKVTSASPETSPAPVNVTVVDDSMTTLVSGTYEISVSLSAINSSSTTPITVQFAIMVDQSVNTEYGCEVWSVSNTSIYSSSFTGIYTGANGTDFSLVVRNTTNTDNIGIGYITFILRKIN